MLDEVVLAESVLRRSYAFDRFAAAAAVLDPSGVIVETNEAWRLFATLNGAQPGTTGPGVDYLEVCDRAFDAGADAAGLVGAGLRAVLRGERGSFEMEYPCPSAIEDRWFILHASTAPVHDGAGLVLFHVNITARKLLEERFGARGERDPATGLPNRRSGMRLIEDGLVRAELRKERLTVIKISVDGLGGVEDELGLPAAEELMVQVTARTMRVLRAGDFVCPLGGDDLVVVCADLEDDVAAGIVNRLDDAIAVPLQLGSSEITLGVNIGIATSKPGSTPIALLAAATAGDSIEVRAARVVEQRSRAAARPPSDIRAGRALPPGRAAAVTLEIARAQRDAVVAHSSDLVLYVEQDGTIAWASPAFQSAMGMPSESLVGRSGFEMIHPDDRDQALTTLGAIPNLGDSARAEHRVVTDNGDVLWIEQSVTNLLDDPHVGYIVANLRDITEHKLYELDPAVRRRAAANLEFARDLRAGIDHDQLYLVFQPVLDLDTNEISSCEALVRWRHPERGNLSPDEFIPVAESTGLIVAIGRWVLPHALAVAVDWPDATRVAVNLSAAELAEPDLVAFVQAELAELDFPARRLVLEITETAVIHDPTVAAHAIGALRALGVGVIIDDFGTGYTSLAFLRDYRIDGLKIDRSFVAELDHGSNAIIDAMIRMSSALGLEVIAEGIETTAQREELRALGCRFIQGYLVSRPVATEDLRFP